jgi:hypothetical protein
LGLRGHDFRCFSLRKVLAGLRSTAGRGRIDLHAANRVDHALGLLRAGLGALAFWGMVLVGHLVHAFADAVPDAALQASGGNASAVPSK